MSTPTVLFVCVHNAGRSVMAEALFNARAGGRARGISAGTEPSPAPHAVVVEALAEIGVDVARHQGRMLTDEMVGHATRVFTMGCAVDEGACPAIRYAAVQDWGLPDPKGRPLEEVRALRDEIATRVDALLVDLLPPGAIT